MHPVWALAHSLFVELVKIFLLLSIIATCSMSGCSRSGWQRAACARASMLQTPPKQSQSRQAAIAICCRFLILPIRHSSTSGEEVMLLGLLSGPCWRFCRWS